MMKNFLLLCIVGGLLSYLVFSSVGCTPQQTETFTQIVNPTPPGNPDGPGALDDVLNAPLPELPQAAQDYVTNLLTGGAGLTLAGLIGLFTKAPGTKKKELAVAEAQFEKGKALGMKLQKAIDASTARVTTFVPDKDRDDS